MNILGISAFYHDSAACLVREGRLIAAAQEERFTRKKHDASFPRQAVAYCLREAGIRESELDFVVFYDKPLRKFDRLLETYLAFAPAGFGSFLKAMPQWLRKKLNMPKEITRQLPGDYRLLFLEHHESHAASAFFPSPFEEAAIITADGVGEWATASWSVGKGNRLEIQSEIRFPHSLGLLYSAFTYFTGFKVNSGEYKLMGLAPYGAPRYRDTILENLIQVFEDGSFRLNMRYFDYCQGLTMTNQRFADLFGGPPREPESPLSAREMDLAASVQAVTEEIMLAMARHVHAQTGLENLCLAGGVALNCVANGRIAREGPFKRLFIQPAAGDAGGALGSALFAWHQYLENPRDTRALQTRDFQHGSLLGPAFSNETIRAYLESVAARYWFGEDEELLPRVVSLLAEGKVVGWFQGRMEFGPRALGNRSILADPRDPAMQKQLNLKIKFRESFRPFAPIVLEKRLAAWFEMEGDSPYMLLVGKLREEHRAGLDRETREFSGIERLQAARGPIPAVTHVDYSARVQTVDHERNPRLHQLLTRWEETSGCPVLVNTSFNVRGEPIVCTPEQAYRCFMATNMDVLVLGNHLLLKEDQPDWPEKEAYLASFEAD